MAIKAPPAPRCTGTLRDRRGPRRLHRWEPESRGGSYLDPRRERCRACGVVRVFSADWRRILYYEEPAS